MAYLTACPRATAHLLRKLITTVQPFSIGACLETLLQTQLTKTIYNNITVITITDAQHRIIFLIYIQVCRVHVIPAERRRFNCTVQ